MTAWTRFVEWYYVREGKPPSAAHDAIDHAAWTAWQAAEKSTAARCARLVLFQSRAPGDSAHDGYARLRAEYPEAFK